MAEGLGMEVTIEDLEHFLRSGNIEAVKTGVMLADEVGIGDEAMEVLCEKLGTSPWHACGTVNGSGLDTSGLRYLKDARIVDPLIQILKEGGGCWVEGVRLPPKAGPAHWSLFQHRNVPNSGSAPCAARALGEIGDARAVDPLIKALDYDGYCIEGFSVAEAAKEALRALHVA